MSTYFKVERYCTHGGVTATITGIPIDEMPVNIKRIKIETGLTAQYIDYFKSKNQAIKFMEKCGVKQ